VQISSLLEDSEIKVLQQKFYEYFETGYSFEEFLKEYLLKMGLDEVEVTQRSRDGGIDLTAIRKGVGDFSEIDITHYYIQAKKYALKTKIRVPAIRELKGTIPFGYKGMIITTSDFTDDAVTESSNDPSKPVVIINGRALVTSCIDNEIGFIFKPIFSNKQMDIFVKKDKMTKNKDDKSITVVDTNFVEKTITANDIRARIVSVPSSIMKQFEEEQKSVVVTVNENTEYQFNINKGRNYFGSVTNFLRDYNMLSDDGVITPKQSKWIYDDENKIIKLYIEEQ
jgi:restriction system protein